MNYETTHRNYPCPCGGKKKAKKCCYHPATLSRVREDVRRKDALARAGLESDTDTDTVKV